jgi:hypothetical protein
MIAAAAAIHLLFLASLVSGWLDPLFNDSTHRLPRGLDFYAVYQKSHEFAEGGSLYARIDPRDLVVPHAAPHFRYLPTWAWVMAHTFCRLEPRVAYGLWVACCESLLLLCLGLFMVRAPSLRERAWQAVIWLCFSPYYLELFMGQFTFAAAGLVALGWLAAERGRGVAATAWLSASVCVKHVGLALLPALLAVGRWRAGLVVLAVPAMLSAPFFLLHPAELARFLDASAYGTPYRLHAGNLGLVALLQSGVRAAGLDPSGPVSAGLSGSAVAAVLVWLAWRTWRLRGAENLVPLSMLWLTGYFLVGPDVYEHHWVLLLPVFAWARLARPSRRLAALYVWLALPTVFVFVDAPGPPHQSYFEVETLWVATGHHGRLLLYHSWKILPTLALIPLLPQNPQNPGHSAFSSSSSNPAR